MNLLTSPPWEADEKIDKPITRTTKKLADDIFAEIIDGTYDYGTRLPAERTFAEKHGVSRASVRQALELLERYGVIERRPGSGAIVRLRQSRAPEQPASAEQSDENLLNLAEIAEITSPLELGVVRSIIEPEIARLAVLNMTSRDVERMKQIQARLEEITVDGEKFSKIDDELRALLAEGSRNPLLITMHRIILQVSSTAAWAVSRRRSLSPLRIKQHQLHNRSLCQAIENRDIESAVEHLKLLLADFHQDLVSSV